MSDSFVIEQTGRLLNLSWSGGPTSLIITRFSGTERVSGLFAFQIDAVSPDAAITPDQIVGQEISWSVRHAGGARRPFSGIVARMHEGRAFGHDYRHYSFDVKPSFWLLTHSANCKIFQNQTVPQIIQAVLGAHPEVKFDTSGLSGTYQPRVYCVQYRESDFAFVCRLMEDEGIFYYFKHDDGSHTMMLGDSPSAWFQAVATPVNYNIQQELENSITQWHRKSRFRGGKWTQRDYNFENPGSSLNTTVTTVLSPPPFKSYEYYDYPGGYMDSGTGDGRSLLRMEAEESSYQEAEASGNVADFATGGRFTVQDDSFTDDADTAGWVALSVTHNATDYSHIGGEGNNEAPSYANSFTCLDDSVKYRPPRVTARPQISGLQIATVVGPAGEEIYTDKYGRIKVQFPWDRLGKNDENSSCWMRVTQLWSGPQWGAQFVPRIGMEVLISFLDGDPDRPVVVGCAYNAKNMPPYKLPDNKTQSGIKSHSSIGGGADEFNELHFEDLKGQEVVWLQAQRDMHGLIKHDETRTIGNDDTHSVGHDQTITIANNRTETVQNGTETVTIQKGKRTVTLGQGDDVLELQQGSRAVSIDKGNDQLTVSQGNLTISVSAGSISITAAQSITLTVGGSSISISPSGVDVKGGTINHN
jgi:type VI secretion system secreted protein VgrG